MKFVRVGYVSGAFGLDGAIRVKPNTENPELFAQMEFLLLAEGVTPVRSLRIDTINVHKDCFIINIEGVSDVESAEALKGLSVVISEDMLPKEDADEIYWYKIEGADVIDSDGHSIGVLSDYMETGSCDVFRIRLTDGGYALVSNNEEHVLKIDTEKKVVTVNLAGLVIEDV